MARSSWLATEPERPGDGEEFLNGCVLVRTSLSARGLLGELNELERRAGREPATARSRGPRTLDLDLILYGAHVVQEADLQVPHPRFRERAFVLQPAVEIAPDLVDPVRGVTLAELWRALAAPSAQPREANHAITAPATSGTTLPK